MLNKAQHRQIKLTLSIFSAIMHFVIQTFQQPKICRFEFGCLFLIDIGNLAPLVVKYPSVAFNGLVLNIS